MVTIKNLCIRNCYVYITKDRHYKCVLGGGNCTNILKGEKFHTGNAKSHLLRKHELEFNSLMANTKNNEIINCSTGINDSVSGSSINRKKDTIKVQVTKSECIQALISLFTISGRPFSILEDPGIKYFVEPYFKFYEIKLNRVEMQNLIKEMANEKREQISEYFKNRIISLKADLTTIHRRSFLSINCQVINNYEIKVFNLYMNEFEGISSGENIKREILRCLETYNLSISQVLSVTIDNSTNLVKALNWLSNEITEDLEANNDDLEGIEIKNILTETGNFNDIACIRWVAHTFQLVMNKFFIEINDKLELIRIQVKELHLSKYKDTFKHYGLPVPTLDNLTRWTSVFKMVESVIISKHILDVFKSSCYNLNVSDLEWAKLNDVHKCLEICNRMTVKLQKQQTAFTDSYYYYLEVIANLKILNSSYAKKAIELITIRLDDFFKKHQLC